MRRATSKQIIDLLTSDELTLIDAVGLDPSKFHLFFDFQKEILRISTLKGFKERVPENITVIIDSEELLIEFDLDDDYLGPDLDDATMP